MKAATPDGNATGRPVSRGHHDAATTRLRYSTTLPRMLDRPEATARAPLPTAVSMGESTGDMAGESVVTAGESAGDTAGDCDGVVAGAHVGLELPPPSAKSVSAAAEPVTVCDIAVVLDAEDVDDAAGVNDIGLAIHLGARCFAGCCCGIVARKRRNTVCWSCGHHHRNHQCRHQ